MNASDAIWSINIMVFILLVCVSFVIYWIFKYDDWYPNPVESSVDSMQSSSSEHQSTTESIEYHEPVVRENERLEVAPVPN